VGWRAQGKRGSARTVDVGGLLRELRELDAAVDDALAALLRRVVAARLRVGERRVHARAPLLVLLHRVGRPLRELHLPVQS